MEFLQPFVNALLSPVNMAAGATYTAILGVIIGIVVPRIKKSIQSYIAKNASEIIKKIIAGDAQVIASLPAEIQGDVKHIQSYFIAQGAPKIQQAVTKAADAIEAEAKKVIPGQFGDAVAGIIDTAEQSINQAVAGIK